MEPDLDTVNNQTLKLIKHWYFLFNKSHTSNIEKDLSEEIVENCV